MTISRTTNRGVSANTPIRSTAPDLFVPNLFVLVAFGVGISAWLLFYTDWFAEVGVLLALSGLFTWLGVVSKLLRKERLEDLQGRVDEVIFTSRRFQRGVVAAAAVLVAAATFVGTIEVRSDGDASDRLLWFDFDSANVGGANRLAAASRVRSVRLTMPWSPAEVRVKVSGYPSAFVRVRPWQRIALHVPTSLRAVPVVLLVPSSDLINVSRGLTLVVSTGGMAHEQRFDGHAVWIGCDDDVEVPPGLVEEWRNTTAGTPELLAYWRFPRAIDIRLQRGSELNVKLLREDRTPFVEIKSIQVSGRSHDFPQVEMINGSP